MNYSCFGLDLGSESVRLSHCGDGHSPELLYDDIGRTQWRPLVDAADSVAIPGDDSDGAINVVEELMQIVDSAVIVKPMATLLKFAKDSAAQELTADKVGAVVAVPAALTIGRRAAVNQAAEIAGLTTLRLVHATSAAALAVKPDGDGGYLVVHLSSLGAEITVAVASDSSVSVLDTVVETDLGGGWTDPGHPDVDALIDSMQSAAKALVHPPIAIHLVGPAARRMGLTSRIRSAFGVLPEVTDAEIAVAKGCALMAGLEQIEQRLRLESRTGVLSFTYSDRSNRMRTLARHPESVCSHGVSVEILDSRSPDPKSTILFPLLEVGCPFPVETVFSLATALKHTQELKLDFFDDGGVAPFMTLVMSSSPGDAPVGTRVDFRLIAGEDGSLDVTGGLANGAGSSSRVKLVATAPAILVPDEKNQVVETMKGLTLQ